MEISGLALLESVFDSNSIYLLTENSSPKEWHPGQLREMYYLKAPEDFAAAIALQLQYAADRLGSTEKVEPIEHYDNSTNFSAQIKPIIVFKVHVIFMTENEKSFRQSFFLHKLWSALEKINFLNADRQKEEDFEKDLFEKSKPKQE